MTWSGAGKEGAAEALFSVKEEELEEDMIEVICATLINISIHCFYRCTS